MELIAHQPAAAVPTVDGPHLHDMASPYKGVTTLPSARDHFPFQPPQHQPG